MSSFKSVALLSFSLRRSLFVAVLLAAQIFVTPVFAQAPAVSASGAAPVAAGGAGGAVVPDVKTSDNVGRGDKNVPVPQEKSDSQITKRLEKIFKVTGWFENLKVTSEEGIVTISGLVAEASQRDWAVTLAKDSDGVVAVINKIDLKQLGWFDLEPAKKEIKGFWSHSFAYFPYLVLALLLLTLAIILYRFVVRTSKPLWGRRIANPILIEVASKLGALPVLLIGLYLVLQVLGLTGLAVTILGGTGALGLVAGFAFQSILQNYFSGIMLSVRRPFVIGDVIEVGAFKGVVYRMTTSGTTLVDFDGNHILIPNTIVFTSPIKNQTASPITRLHMSLEVEKEVADGGVSDIQSRVEKALREQVGVLQNPETKVSIENTSALSTHSTIEIYFWIDVHETNTDKIKEAVMERVRSGLSGSQKIVVKNVGDAAKASTKADASKLLEHAKSHPAVEDKGHDLL